MPKYLLLFEKGESIRWLGHLDILRTFERAIRRASLPIAFSAGFNPRERLAFASALSTGVTGGEERATLELTDPLETTEIITRLNGSLPSGIRISSCTAVSDAEAKEEMNSHGRGEYHVICDTPEDATESQISNAIEALLAKSEIIVMREKEKKTKKVDIRPAIFSLSLQAKPEATQAENTLQSKRITLEMIVGQGESGTAKPQEVVSTLAEIFPGLTFRRSHRARMLKTRV